MTVALAAGLGGAELAGLERLLDPDGDGYVVKVPGYYVVHPAIVATGRLVERRPGPTERRTDTL